MARTPEERALLRLTLSSDRATGSDRASARSRPAGDFDVAPSNAWVRRVLSCFLESVVSGATKLNAMRWMEVDGDFLYCALARGGVAVLDISRPSGAPLNIQPFVILDTPGLAQGVAFRGTGVSRQLIVGDSRAGLRLYGRSAQ